MELNSVDYVQKLWPGINKCLCHFDVLKEKHSVTPRIGRRQTPKRVGDKSD